MRLPIRELAIDVFGHGDHVSRDLFVMFFVAREIALHVTEVTFNSQCSRERPHSRDQILIGRQQLQILRRRMLLPKGSHCEKQCRKG
jgi:hypothetical protein